MKKYIEQSTPKTPKLSFDPESGVFEISGRSIPENSTDFYDPLLNWLDKYIEAPQEMTNVTINLEYFNTSSSKCLIEIFRRFEKLKINGNSINVKWFYEEEDEDMFESGQDFREIIKVPMELMKI